MARDRFGRLVLLAFGFWIPAAGTLCLGQETSVSTATRPRYALTFISSNESVPTNSNLNTSRVMELVPAKYHKRYLKWRNDYLSTAAGRSEWNRYARDSGFTLTITVSKDLAEGAIVDSYKWDENGRLTAATIRLGNKLDSGYPSSINYPVTCSLAPGHLPPEVKGTILGATKIAHEFGHLDHMMSMDGRTYELQNRLMLEYNRIFDSNGRDVRDPRLLELAKEMDGTPVSIKQDRECWAEAGAALYLQERLAKNRKIKMPGQIRDAIEAYYLTYPGRVE